MNVFEQEIKVTEEHLDSLNHVNNVQYVQWVQDIAAAHWGRQSNKELNEQYFWVLIDHHIHYKGQAVLGDVVTAKTYVEKSEGVISHRVVEFYKKEDILICKSETQWCLISRSTQRPTRIPNLIVDLFS
ncbi:acyl-CoA thioesterase [Aegicerativicinus sediminis]